ncbi:MAG: LamG-like jellyroll fold domain-containing protein [Pseudomonadota bacterium]
MNAAIRTLAGLALMAAGSTHSAPNRTEPGWHCENLYLCLKELGLEEQAQAAAADLPEKQRTELAKGLAEADRLTPSQKLLTNDVFDLRDGQLGTAVAFGNNLAVVSAPFYGQRQGEDYGYLFIFERNLNGPGAWGHITNLDIFGGDSHPGANNIRNQSGALGGVTLAVSGNTIAYGAPQLDLNDPILPDSLADQDIGRQNVGSVFIVELLLDGDPNCPAEPVVPDDSAYCDAQQTHQLLAADANNETTFGDSVSLAGDTLAVGAPGIGVQTSNGLVAHYTFDADANDVQGGANGILVAPASITAESRIGGGALDLRGVEGYVNLPSWPLGERADECTIAFWMSTESISGDGHNALVQSAGSDVDAFRVTTEAARTAGFQFVGPGITTSLSGAAPNDNAWTHVAATYSRVFNNALIYVNGALVDEVEFGASPFNVMSAEDGFCGNDRPVAIGAWDTDNAGNIGYYHDGRLDDLRVYDRRLNSSEIQSLFDETNIGFQFGAFYIYERDLGGAGNWGLRLRQFGPDGFDGYGGTVLLDGNNLAIKNDGFTFRAAVHSRDTGGADQWGEIVSVTPPGLGEFDRFRRQPLALTGSDLFILGVDDSFNSTVWRYDVPGGSLQQTIASTCDTPTAIAASPDYLALGRNGVVCMHGRDSGGAGNWGEITQINGPPGNTAFGTALNLAGGELLIGAPGFDRPNSNADAGRAYVHREDQGGAGQWGEVAALDLVDTEFFNRFGISMDQDGDVLVVGGNGEANTLAINGGNAYVFERAGPTAPWQFVTKLNPISELDGVRYNDRSNYAFDVAVSGTTIAVSSSVHSTTGFTSDGLVAVFERQFGSWNLVKYLTLPDSINSLNNPFDGGSALLFGYNVDVSGDTIATALPFNFDPVAGEQDGRLFVYYRNEGGANNWGLIAETRTDPFFEFLGRDIHISDDESLIIAGADQAADGAEANTGAAYIFGRDTGGTDNWGQIIKLMPAQLQADDRFGRAVAISSTHAVVTAPNASPTVGEQENGTVFVFDRNGGGPDTWTLQDISTPSVDLQFQSMGVSVSLDGDYFALGAPSFGSALNFQEGSVYLFEFDPTGAGGDFWKEIAAIRPDDGFLGNFLGRSIDLSDRTISVGASFDNAPNEESGSLYVLALPDLEIFGATAPTQTETGAAFNINITPANSGDGAADDAVLTVDAPSICVSLSAASAGAGWSTSFPQAGISRFSINLGSIGADGSLPTTLTLDATGTVPVPGACAPFSVDMAVGNAGTTGTPDYFNRNDTFATQITLVEPSNLPPTGTIPNLDFPAGTEVSIDFNEYFTDPNGDSLTFSASGLPASLQLNSQTGIAAGTTTVTDFNNSPFSVNVTATDVPGGLSSTPVNFTLTLTNVSPTEVFPLPDYTTVVGEDLLIDVSPFFTDGDGQSLQYSLSGSTAYTIGNFGQPGLIRGVATTTQLQQSPIDLNLTVSDGFGQQVVRQLTITVEDQLAPEFDFERFFPALQQPWYFSDIQDVATAPDGTVYLADAERGKVMRFSKDGLLVTQWGQLGADPGQFSFLSLKLGIGPEGLVYTASGSRLQIFGKNGDFLTEVDLVDDIIDLAVDLNGQLYLLLSDGISQRVEIRAADQLGLIVDTISVARPPASVAVTEAGRVYVALRSSGSPQNNDNIIPYDPPGYAPGIPIVTTDADDLSLDSNGILFAVGDADAVIRGYDAAGALQINNNVASVGGPSLSALDFGQQDRKFISNGPSIFGVEGNTDTRLFAWQSASDEVGRFRRPSDVSRDGSDNLYVVEAEQSRVQRFARNGDILAGWALAQPVADPANARVYIHATSFSPTRVVVSTGAALELYDAGGSLITPNPFDPGSLTQPGPVDETAAGDLVVTDTGGVGTQVWVINSAGVVLEGPWTAPNCNATSMATGLNNLIYLLCEPGVQPREIQAFTLGGTLIANATITLPPGNPRGLAIDDNGRLFLLNTENEIDLGFGITSSDSLIRVYRSDGVELGQLGASGYSAGRFDFGGEVAGISVSSAGDLVLAEPGNNRVQVLNPRFASPNTKAIVVAGGGDYPENFLWEATQINANNAYDKLVYQGFTADRIQYLHPDPNLDLDGNPATTEVDGDPTLANLEQAITSWAADADNLVVYLADHGDKEVFRMNPEEIIDSTTLASWLAQLQDSAWPNRAQPPVGNSGWITVVYEACESGTFQDNLAPQNSVATNKRLVITTSSSDQNASFIAQGLLSFSYQFWINVFNGDNVRDAFELASATISTAYPQQAPLLSLVDGGSLVTNLDAYFDDGGANAGFAGRFIGNGTANSFIGPDLINPSASLVSGSTGLLEVQSVLSANDVSRVWVIIEPPGYQVRDSENPILELPTVDLDTDCVSGADYCGEFSGFTTIGDYRIQFLAQDIFGTVSRLAGSEVTLTVGNPLRNKAALLIGGGADEAGQARLSNGDFAYQALLRQDFLNDLDASTPGVTPQEDEIRYFTQGQFVGADIGTPGGSELANLVNGGFVDPNTQHLALVIIADYDSTIDALVFPGQAPLPVPDLDAFLASVEGQIQGKIAVILEGDGTGSVIPRLAGSSGRRLLISSTSPGETAKVLGDGGISFSKFFWNAIRDGFSLGTAFQLASQAIAQGVGVQNPMLDDNGNGISNDPADQIVSRNFFLGPGLARAGNGPLVGRLAPDVTIDAVNVNSATILAENVSSLSDVSVSVMGSVSVPGTQLQVGEFTLTEVGGVQKGQQVINLGDFSGTFDGFVAAGDYDVSVFAVDDKGNPSTPQKSRVRKTAGPDIFEVDNTPSASTPLVADAAPQRHTLHLASDEDWLVFFLTDSQTRVLDLSFNQLDPGLRLLTELYAGDRLTDDTVAPVLSQVVDPGVAGTDVTIPDTLPAGMYFARISRQSFQPQPDSDGSPGYNIGLSSPFGDLGGLLRGKVVDESTGQAVGLARVAAITADGAFCGAPPCEAGVVPTCDRASCGDQGGFVLFLNQGGYDVEVSAPGYETTTVSSLNVQPGGTTLVTPDPILLTPEASAVAPTALLQSAGADGEVRANLSGLINANGSQTTGRFLIGTSAQNLSEIPPGFLVAGSIDEPVATVATGLTCSTSYVVRLAAENAGGQVESLESELTTADCGSTGQDVVFANGFE